MRHLFITVLFLILFAVPLWAQTVPNIPDQVVAGGVSVNEAGKPIGSLFYAKSVNASSKTYSFNVVDIYPTFGKPFSVLTSTTPGIGQYVFTIAGAPVYAVTSFGTAVGGQGNVGYSFTWGGAAFKALGSGGWGLMIHARGQKSSLSDLRFIGGIAVGWGK